jgi:hypothetical protein
MLKKEEVFMNHQNRYQDNLGPLFTPQPTWVLSYPSQSQVKHESKKVSIQDSYLSDRSCIKLENESDQDSYRTCIKLEHEPDQDSDRVSIKRPIPNIHELDGDAMLKKEEVFMNHQNRYQDNLGPLFTPQPNWVLSYPSEVKREVFNQDSYLSDYTCIKLEHESDQDSDRVSIKRHITDIHEIDGDAMLKKEEVFMNYQNRYQDNLDPFFIPLRQSARLEPNWVLSYPSQVKREPEEEISNQDSYLSDRTCIKLEHESDQDFDRTCIKLEHESDQDSDSVLIKIEPPDSASDEEVYPNVKLEEYEHKVSNIKSEPCTDASQASIESKEHQSNSETSISHREYVPLSKSLHQPRSQSDENYVSSCVNNVNPSSTGSSSLYTRKNQVSSSSSRLQTDSYEKDALSDRLQYQDNEKMDLDLPRTSQKRKGKRNEDSSKDKKQKGKAKDDAGTKSEIEQVTSTIGISTPVLPYDPIDDYQMEPVNPDKHLLTFPFKKPQGRNSVIVYKHDEDRLNDKRFLNDTLLEVFPKIWTEQFPSASIHTFSPFFFTKLCGKDLDAFKYDDVKRWTKDDDIFKKKVLIVPINQSNHWYILLVTNPGYCIQGDKSNEFREGLNSDYGESNNSRPKTRKRMINPGTKLNQQK